MIRKRLRTKTHYMVTSPNDGIIDNSNEKNLNDYIKQIQLTLQEKETKKVHKDEDEEESIEMNQNFIMKQALLKDTDKFMI